MKFSIWYWEIPTSASTNEVCCAKLLVVVPQLVILILQVDHSLPFFVIMITSQFVFFSVVVYFN